MSKIFKVPFEEALGMAGFGKFNCLMFILNLTVVTSMAFEVFSVSFLVPASACELKTTVYQQGLIAGTPLLGIIASSQIWGYLADTRGRRKILLWSLALGFCAGFLATISPNWIALSVLKFLSSTALAASYPVAITFLSELTPQSKRSLLVSCLSTQIFFASALMAILSIPVLHVKISYYIPFLNINFVSWRLLNIIFALPSLIGAFGVWLSYESPRFLVSIGEDEKAIDVLKNIYLINTGKSRDDYMVESITLDETTGDTPGASMWSTFASQTVTLFKPPLLKSTLLLSLLLVICYFSMQPFLIWLPFISDGFMRSLEAGDTDCSFCDMLRLAGNQTTTENGDCSLNEFAMMSVFTIYLLLSVMNCIFSSSINLFGKKRLIISFQLISSISALVMNLAHQYILNAVLFVVYTISTINFTFLSIYVVELYPTHVKATAVCLTLMLGRGSSALGINILKSLLTYNCELAFYFFGGLTLVGSLIAFLLPTDKKKEHILEE
ncbi:putative transporter svop-1 [Zerene cesonia]|uniref:putative transporter svop-1 n=1 Tax=Zerene cesonia TaxID=33412 RepID=UPI0018E540E8|nr:putative transporter svop-1 [Zerene cesonia]